MIFNWFDARQAKKFGAALALFFIEKTPANRQIGEKKFTEKTQKILKQMAEQVACFKSGNRLNTYKKAQLGNAFKWALKDAGFAPDYIDQLTKWLMLQIS